MYDATKESEMPTMLNSEHNAVDNNHRESYRLWIYVDYINQCVNQCFTLYIKKLVQTGGWNNYSL